MSVLGPHFRIVLENRLGQTISTAGGLTVKMRGWKFDIAGQMSFQTPWTTILNLSTVPLGSPTTLTNLSFLTSNVVENLTTGFIGAELEVTVVAPASSSGEITVYLDRSIDGGSTWNDLGIAQIIGYIPVTTAGVRRITVHI
jgi:hypothetical protein